MNKFILPVLLTAVFFVSCRTTKNIAAGKIGELTIEQIDRNIQDNSFHFTTFYASAKVNIKSSSMDQNATAVISMQQDSFIGISLRVLGVEAIKVLITQDSVEILDRLNRKYIPRDYSYIEKMFGVQTDLRTLQNLITGDLIYNTGTMYPLAADTCNCYRIAVKNGALTNTINLFPTFDVEDMFVEDAVTKRTLLLQYRDYKKVERVEQIGRQNFSFLRTMKINAVEMYNIEMQFTNVTLDQPLDFTFSVNAKYEKVSE